jgi:hypothetical protein
LTVATSTSKACASTAEVDSLGQQEGARAWSAGPGLDKLQSDDALERSTRLDAHEVHRFAANKPAFYFERRRVLRPVDVDGLLHDSRRREGDSYRNPPKKRRPPQAA